MKRIFYTALCALMTLGASAQTEKVMRVHMTDGTVKEYHVGALRDFSFTGKAVVNDDDYTQISKLDLVIKNYEVNVDVTANFGFDDMYITGNRYGRDWGILYSTSPDVTIENGTLVDLKSPLTSVDDLSSHSVSFRVGESVRVRENYYNDEGAYVDLEYATTYYFRSFVYRPAIDDLYEEQYFYSAVKSVNTGNPSMKYYGVYDIPAYAAEYGYVFPTDEAWNAFDEQYPYFSLSIPSCKETIITRWNEYLTPERIEEFKSQCSVSYECAEGLLYFLDVIGEDFCQYLLSIYEVDAVLSGEADVLDASSNTVATYIECDASWNVPGNGYWKYTADTRKNPTITFSLPECLMANYLYDIEIILAPNTDAEETLPSKVTARMSYREGGSVELASKYETNVAECSVITVEGLEIETFTEATLEIASVMGTGSRDPDKGKFLPILRVAQIKVIPRRK